MLRQITVKCLPAIQFEVPIFFEFDPQSDPIPGLVPAETGELLTV